MIEIARAILLMILHRFTERIPLFSPAKRGGDFGRAEGLHSELGAESECSLFIALHRMPSVPDVPKMNVARPLVMGLSFHILRDCAVSLASSRFRRHIARRLRAGRDKRAPRMLFFAVLVFVIPPGICSISLLPHQSARQARLASRFHLVFRLRLDGGKKFVRPG